MFNEFDENLLELNFNDFETKYMFHNNSDLIYLVYIKKCCELGFIFNPNISEDDFKDKPLESKPIELKHFKKGFKNATKTKDIDFFINGVMSDYLSGLNEFKRVLTKMFNIFIKINTKSKEDNLFYVNINDRFSEILKNFNISLESINEKIIEVKEVIVEVKEVKEVIVEEKNIKSIFEDLVKK